MNYMEWLGYLVIGVPVFLALDILKAFGEFGGNVRYIWSERPWRKP